jgi:hypothetical protein
VGRLVVEALPGSIIQLFHYLRNFFFRDVPEVRSFREVVSEQAVGILIGSPLPGCIRIGKIDRKPGGQSRRSFEITYAANL